MARAQLAKARTSRVQAAKENLSILSTRQCESSPQTPKNVDEILVCKSISGS